MMHGLLTAKQKRLKYDLFFWIIFIQQSALITHHTRTLKTLLTCLDVLVKSFTHSLHKGF